MFKALVLCTHTAGTEIILEHLNSQLSLTHTTPQTGQLALSNPVS